MLFEFDPQKSASNWRRHGIDFLDAQDLWDRSHVIIPAKHVSGESRHVILGKLEGELYLAVFPKRGTATRIISCHRADNKWERVYETHINKKENA